MNYAKLKGLISLTDLKIKVLHNKVLQYYGELTPVKKIETNFIEEN